MGSLYRRTTKGNWQAQFTDHTGKVVQRSTGTSVKKLAAEILANWETDAVKRAKGLIDPDAERLAAQRAKAIRDHVDDFERSLEAKGGTKNHANQTLKTIRDVVESGGWQTLTDMTPESVERYIATLQGLGRSNRTIARHAQAVKQFATWLTTTARIARNPLLTVTKPNPGKDRRRVRRMLLPGEWPWLAEASGERSILYETAIETGLRASELRSLKPTHVVTDATPPYVVVESGGTKDGQTARQYLSKGLADRLAQLKAASRSAFFTMPPKFSMADVLRKDLDAARAAWLARKDSSPDDVETDFLCATNDAGEVLDFHSLRHTCGAWLAVQGVHPKTIQTVMRHKSITLTMDTYGHLFPSAEPEAIESLGRLLRRQ
jgi:integrase